MVPLGDPQHAVPLATPRHQQWLLEAPINGFAIVVVHQARRQQDGRCVMAQIPDVHRASRFAGRHQVLTRGVKDGVGRRGGTGGTGGMLLWKNEWRCCLLLVLRP